MQIVTLYAVTALIFLAADAVMLRTVMKPLFTKHLGDAVLDSPRLGAAVGFYLVYIAILLYFVSVPALRDGAAGQALLNGALIGIIGYGTYEMTSYAVMRDWSLEQVAADLTWGTVLTALSAWLGVLVTRAIFGG
ncbi:hypothetical protein ATO8_17030 [Roseivivax marinus]|uniref:Transmembrane protein n=1 Tax=Roseivivax marinus TaxID=1379903 RepID=W4HHG1_9RHOB|nr:DUF2177 family protein [Roseivivax marinus]ETW11395.1 hypothetical protein ATO8_17030 [Roseivivax marinus]UMA66803.1 DUF2177 family protein [Roseivivax marinus]